MKYIGYIDRRTGYIVSDDFSSSRINVFTHGSKKYVVKKEVGRYIEKVKECEHVIKVVTDQKIIDSIQPFYKHKITITEYKGIDLRRFIKDGGLKRLDMMKLLTICLKIAKTVKCFHDKNICHYDIATRNILIDNDEITFIDFDFSTECTDELIKTDIHDLGHTFDIMFTAFGNVDKHIFDFLERMITYQCTMIEVITFFEECILKNIIAKLYRYDTKIVNYLFKSQKKSQKTKKSQKKSKKSQTKKSKKSHTKSKKSKKKSHTKSKKSKKKSQTKS